ncbi:hypothetical protein ACNKHT_12130 [Shigella flexneri]
MLEVHSSAGAPQLHRCVIVTKDMSMSSDEHADEYSRYIVDGAAVTEMKGIIERHQANDFYRSHHVAEYDACSYQAPAISTGAFFYP